MTSHRPSTDPAQQASRIQALAGAIGLLAEALRELEYARLTSSGAAIQVLLAEAQDRLWGVVAQREALGIRHHAVLLEVLRVPPEVGAALRPAPERTSVSA